MQTFQLLRTDTQDSIISSVRDANRHTTLPVPLPEVLTELLDIPVGRYRAQNQGNGADPILVID